MGERGYGMETRGYDADGVLGRDCQTNKDKGRGDREDDRNKSFFYCNKKKGDELCKSCRHCLPIERERERGNAQGCSSWPRAADDVKSQRA